MFKCRHCHAVNKTVKPRGGRVNRQCDKCYKNYLRDKSKFVPPRLKDKE